MSFSTLENSMLSLKTKREISELRGFLSGTEAIERMGRTYLRRETPNYNLFNILNINHLEAKVHTPFLADLLSVEGLHQQGNLFINSFLHSFLPVFSKLNQVEVHQEKSIPNGFIDLLVLGRSKGIPRAIIIENKIYANDQPQQLERYYNYVLKTMGVEKEDIRIIYLTPNGKDPNVPYSINKKLYTELVESGYLKPLSYSKDIVGWLISVLGSIESDKVKFTIQQYIQTIKNI
jgi:hypothetical protein